MPGGVGQRRCGDPAELRFAEAGKGVEGRGSAAGEPFGHRSCLRTGEDGLILCVRLLPSSKEDEARRQRPPHTQPCPSSPIQLAPRRLQTPTAAGLSAG